MMGDVRHLHLHQNITRKKLALGLHLAPAAHFDHFFEWYENFFKKMVEPGRLRSFADCFSHFFLEIRIGVHNIPALCHAL